MFDDNATQAIRFGTRSMRTPIPEPSTGRTIADPIFMIREGWGGSMPCGGDRLARDIVHFRIRDNRYKIPFLAVDS